VLGGEGVERHSGHAPQNRRQQRNAHESKVNSASHYWWLLVCLIARSAGPRNS
jgi:hypothetical protein